MRLSQRPFSHAGVLVRIQQLLQLLERDAYRGPRAAQRRVHRVEAVPARADIQIIRLGDFAIQVI